MKVLVFCSAQNVPEKYTKAAAEFAALLAKKGHTLVWGGSNVGTMKVIADAAQAAGGKVIGVSIEHFSHKARKNADEMFVAKTPSERKRIMLERADAVVALAGGLGTLDEAVEVAALKRNKHHTKPLVFLNTDGFYEGIQIQLQRMEKDGFLADRDGDSVIDAVYYFADTPEEAIRYLE
jgi:uncharacterized protein (TIGR00730 family)